MTAHRKALARLWTDRASVYLKAKATDPATHLTGFSERLLAEGVPCRLSFKSLAVSGGSPVASLSQQTVLFLAPEVEVPPGCRIAVQRGGSPEKELVFARSGLPGVYSDHQEVPLEPFRGYA